MNKIDGFKKIDGLEAVILFGSKARNDADNNSDVDIFILIDDNYSEVNKNNLIKKVSRIIDDKKTNVSLYSKEVFNKMLDDGSMFLWHLKLEGKYIFNRYNMDIFKGLNDFQNYRKNLNLYKDLFAEAKESITTNMVNSYDLSMLFFLCRNLSLLTCFKIGRPNFGKYSAYNELIYYLGFEPIRWENYIILSKWRMNFTRGIGDNLMYPSVLETNKIISEIEVLFSFCEEILSKEVNQ
ncbi:nucleotidyltransferase domain-containing protein [Salipaludibacillus sp. HK11]|uniref:nucleotidyltransferase domain-containing protein n=1 Tax=Salipaludibacillus sp. HK11 TaxID=3394320 RepID=UPI0039FC3B63